MGRARKLDIKYKETQDISPEDVSSVFEQSEIKRPYHDLERLERMIRHANLIITAWAGDKMVGIARALTDYSYCCYLSDLAVDKNYQKHGIGKELIRRVQEKIGEEAALILIAAPSAVDYYPKIGFTRNERAYFIPRSK
jgi:ribosomal protein S18 acetylase RimI-like enzyme